VAGFFPLPAAKADQPHMRMKNAKGEQGRIPDGLESMVDRVASIEKTLGIL
jgi:hypothetical protein